MYGKYRNNFVCKLLLILVLFYSYSHSQDTNFLVNGYRYDATNTNYNKAIRLQGIGDFLFKNKSYAAALPYYEQTLALLPSEADSTFKLAEIYQLEKLWRLSVLYYEETIKLLQKDVNLGKSQLNRYISCIRIAQVYHAQGDSEKARNLIIEIRKQVSLLQSSYPEAYEELSFFDTIYPITPIRQVIEQQ